MLFPLFKGFYLGGSLIVAVGAQNAFVIKQGLRKQYLFITALLCSLLDACLIALGIGGFGHILANYPLFISLAKYFAAIFLLAYGATAFYSAFKNTKALDQEEAFIEKQSMRRTILLLLALTLLNPHVYLDTVILLGSIASQHPLHEQLYFAIGAIGASFIWFFSITYGAKLLAPLFRNKKAWKCIDIATGSIMWAIAISLLISP